MAAIEGRQPFAILLSRRADEGVAKFQSMAPAISAQTLTGQRASGGVNGHSVQPGKQGRDPLLLSGCHASPDFGSAYRCVSKSLASRCLCGDPSSSLGVAPKDLDEHIGEIRRPFSRAQAGCSAGLILAFRWKTLSGSYSALIRASRSYFADPYEARTRSSSYSAMKFT